MQLDKKVILNQAILKRQISYIKGALIIILKNLEEQAVDQREIIQILVPVNDIVIIRLLQERFKLKDKDKLRVNLKHLAYYILAWIAYIDNIYNIYRAPKDKYRKYLTRMYQIINKKQYKDIRYMYRWHLVEVQELGDLIL